MLIQSDRLEVQMNAQTRMKKETRRLQHQFSRRYATTVFDHTTFTLFLPNISSKPFNQTTAVSTTFKVLARPCIASFRSNRGFQMAGVKWRPVGNVKEQHTTTSSVYQHQRTNCCKTLNITSSTWAPCLALLHLS